jgi:hypothetical protein
MMLIEYTFVDTMMWIRLAVKHKILADVVEHLYRIDEGEVSFHIDRLVSFSSSCTLLDLLMFCGYCEKLEAEILTDDK